MKGDSVPDEHHVSRLCSKSQLSDEGDPTAAAFVPRPQDTYLSVNWLDYLKLLDRDAEIAEIRQVMACKKMTVRTSAKFAVLKVGRARAIVREESTDNRELSVLHEPDEQPESPQDPSHSGIHNYGPEDELIAELLSRAVQETHPGL